MSKRKKRKLKKPFKIILGGIITFIGLYCLLYFFIDIKLIGDREINLNVNNDYFENGYSASILGKELDVEVINNIDPTKLSDYTVEYKTSFLGISKKIVRKVHVVDSEKPKLELKGNNVIYLKLHEKYEEPGFTAQDNVDGEITNKVKVTGNVDSDKVGIYIISYEVSDSFGNVVKLDRQIEVMDESMLTASIEDFSLDGYFTKTTLKYENKEYDYFKDTVFLGDSNTTFLYLNGKHIAKEQTWGRNNLNIAQINSASFKVFADGKNYTIKDAVEKFKPKYLIVSPGINAVLHMKKDTYLKELQNFIDFMKNYPETKIAFVSIFPINYGSILLSHQKTINEYNYYLAELCYKNNISFINFAKEVKLSDGYADKKYYECTDTLLNCNFHLNTLGKDKYIDYIKHLNLGGM